MRTAKSVQIPVDPRNPFLCRHLAIRALPGTGYSTGHSDLFLTHAVSAKPASGLFLKACREVSFADAGQRERRREELGQCKANLNGTETQILTGPSFIIAGVTSSANRNVCCCHGLISFLPALREKSSIVAPP